MPLVSLRPSANLSLRSNPRRHDDEELKIMMIKGYFDSMKIVFYLFEMFYESVLIVLVVINNRFFFTIFFV